MKILLSIALFLFMGLAQAATFSPTFNFAGKGWVDPVQTASYDVSNHCSRITGQCDDGMVWASSADVAELFSYFTNLALADFDDSNGPVECYLAFYCVLFDDSALSFFNIFQPSYTIPDIYGSGDDSKYLTAGAYDGYTEVTYDSMYDGFYIIDSPNPHISLNWLYTPSPSSTPPIATPLAPAALFLAPALLGFIGFRHQVIKI